MAKKKITIESLAGMVNRGFDEIRADMATKEDLKHFATKQDLVEFKDDIIGEVRNRRGSEYR